MDKTLITKLQKAGVDAQVILELIMDEEAAAPATGADSTVGTGASAETGGTVQAAGNPADTPAGGTGAIEGTDKILAAINKLTGAIQASNIRAGGRVEAKETTDDILATIINPREGGK